MSVCWCITAQRTTETIEWIWEKRVVLFLLQHSSEWPMMACQTKYYPPKSFINFMRLEKILPIHSCPDFCICLALRDCWLFNVTRNKQNIHRNENEIDRIIKVREHYHIDLNDSIYGHSLEAWLLPLFFGHAVCKIFIFQPKKHKHIEWEKENGIRCHIWIVFSSSVASIPFYGQCTVCHANQPEKPMFFPNTKK